MSKRKKYHNRLEEIFDESELIQPDPGEGKPSVEEADVERWYPQPIVLPSAESLPGEFESLAGLDPRSGWSEFLDAIDRSERIGFTFDLANISPLVTSLPQVSDTIISPSRDNDGNVLTTPLIVGDTPVGSLHLEGSTDQQWSPQVATVVANVARQIAQHVENLRLLEQADKFRKEAEGAIRRLTREGWEGYLETSAVEIPGFVYDQERVTPLENETDVGLHSLSHHVEHAIKVREETIGKLAVEEAQNEVVIELVDAVAERLSLHIEALRLLEETERSRQQLDKHAAELETVARVSTAAASILDPQTLLQSVVDLTKYSFNLYHAHVFLIEGDRLVLKAGTGKVGQQLLAENFYIWVNQEPSLVADCARKRQGIIVNDVRSDPLYLHHPLLPETISELCMPMIIGDQLLGVIDVHSNIANRFTEDDTRTYSTLAAQVSVALRNAELYAEQMETVERLRELDHLKSSFLANMSHELRTPLNAILGFTQVIIEGIDGPLTDMMLSDLELIEKNSQHLLKLINDVLDMAKIEAGRFSLSIEHFDVRELMEDVMISTSSLAQERNLYLTMKSDLQQDFHISADQFRLRQVLLNLIGNAIKFTDEGGVTVYIERTTREEQPFVDVRISDTGIGIPPDKLETIFEAFSQVDTSTTRKVGGTGLGLPISRRLVELHGGHLWAESTGIPGEGSILHLELPIVAVYE